MAGQRQEAPRRKTDFTDFYLLNRPSLSWFGRAAFDIALRCNGLAINFKGSQGLTVGEENFLRRHLEGRNEGVMFDVGANNGAYTSYLRKLVPAATIYAFEPHPLSFEYLRKATTDVKTILINQALSDKPGRMQLFDLAGHDGSTQASLSHDAVKLFSEGVVEHEVSVTTLDDFMDAQRIDRIDYLKIDTEGFDLKVLLGASRALAAGRIGTIQFEFIPANVITNVRMRDFISLLSQHTIYRVCLNGELLPLTPYDVKRVEIYVMQNLIALPKRHQARPG